MEELKALVSIISGLPTLATWVMLGFLFYKLSIIGSVYGLIRFMTGHLFDWLKVKKTRYEEITPLLDGMTISGSLGALKHQLQRLRGKNLVFSSDYVHECSVDWLRQAIDDKEAKDLSKLK